MNETPKTNSGVSKPNRSFPWTWIVLALVLSAPVLFVGYLVTIPYQAIWSADHGFKRAQKTIDPETLRSWAIQKINESTNGFQIPAEQLPEKIQTLYGHPPRAKVVGSNVCFIWGGGFFHWGLWIGNTNNLRSFHSDNSAYPYNFEWKPGIYYTREADWKLQ